MSHPPTVFDVPAVATPIAVPRELYLALYNSGEITVYVDLTGHPAVIGALTSIEIPPGETLPTTPLGMTRISAISRVAGGRLVVVADEIPITSLPKRENRPGRIIRGFDVTFAADADAVVYNVATDMIAAANGHKVESAMIFCKLFGAYVRLGAVTTAVTVPECIPLEAGDAISINGIEEIDSIHARNLVPGSNARIHGFVIGS